jgi:hypothetical protein
MITKAAVRCVLRAALYWLLVPRGGLRETGCPRPRAKVPRPARRRLSEAGSRPARQPRLPTRSAEHHLGHPGPGRSAHDPCARRCVSTADARTVPPTPVSSTRPGRNRDEHDQTQPRPPHARPRRCFTLRRCPLESPHPQPDDTQASRDRFSTGHIRHRFFDDTVSSTPFLFLRGAGAGVCERESLLSSAIGGERLSRYAFAGSLRSGFRASTTPYQVANVELRAFPLVRRARMVQKNRAPPSAAKGKKRRRGRLAPPPEKGKRIKGKRVPICAFS